MKDYTTITVPRGTVEKLKKLRVHPRQPLYEVIEWLMEKLEE